MNIRFSDLVCLSFIDVFVQKGFKIKGKAAVLGPGDDRYEEQRDKLVAVIGPGYPILSVIEVTPMKMEPIIAPSYSLFPGRTESEQIAQALETHRVCEHLQKGRTQ